MLSELKMIADAVEEMVPRPVHPWIRPMPKKQRAYLVTVDRQGMQSCIPLDDETWSRMRQCFKSNHASFPLVRIGLHPDKEHVNPVKVTKMVKICQDVLGREGIPENWACFRETVQELEDQGRMTEIVAAVAESIRSEMDDEPKKDDRAQVVFNMVHDEFLHSDASWSAISDVLLAPGDGQKSEDAFGTNGKLLKKASNMSLPRVGTFFTYSRNPQTPCLARYGLKGMECFPLSDEEDRRIVNAIAYLTAKEREGKTWSATPVVRGGKSVGTVLTLAFVDARGKKADAIQKFLSYTLNEPTPAQAKKQKEKSSENSFVAKTTRAIKTIQGMPEKIDANVYIFSTFKPKNGACNLLYFKRASCDEILERMREWGAHCKLPLARALQVINKTWTMNAGVLGKNKVAKASLLANNAFRLHELYSLVFDGDDNVRRRLLSLFSRSHLHLIADMANRYQLNAPQFSKGTARSDYWSAMQIAEYLLGDTGDSDARALGSLLRLGNVMHMQYRRRHKAKVEPRASVAFTHMRLMLSHPARCLESLGKKMYASFADASQLGAKKRLREKERKVFWAWRKHCAAVGEVPTTLSDRERLEVVLGFAKGRKHG